MPTLKVCASILFPLPLPEAFDYAVPEGMDLSIGDHVVAPLGKRVARGVVWDLKSDDGKRALKTVSQRYDAAGLSHTTVRFVDWAARYLVQPPGIVLRTILRGEDSLMPSPTDTVYRLTGRPPARMTPAREKVLDAMHALEAPTAAEIAREAGVSSGVVKGLVEAGALESFDLPKDPPFPDPDPDRPGLDLSDLQAGAADTLKRLVRAGGFQCALLDGVTGSGKTEVYFEAIAEALKSAANGQVLVLLPEIALTQSILKRFTDRFLAEPAVWHSGLPPKERRRVWREINEGRARIAIGARSSVFLPFRNLRLAVVDEEHDPTYKQSDGLIYQARDLAVARAKIDGAAVVLASATPSLESLVNARSGRYVHVPLPARVGTAVLPQIETIDLRQHAPPAGRWLSDPMVAAMKDTLAAGEQVLLFLNRRGYAPLVLCRDCGHRMTAPDTQTMLVEHRFTGMLVCHLTGFSMPKPEVCPNCGARDSLTSVGPGVERIAEEATAHFPDATIELFSSDMAGGAEAIRQLVDRMERGEIDILVGTQIAAKGHNFPHLTLVGVVDADLGLAGGDPRAGERTYQTLVQVAGRAGRADKPGRALLQTHDPEHEAIAALVAGDRDAFLDVERASREMLQLPPYGRLASVMISAQSEDRVERAAAEVARCAPMADGITIWGPAEPRYGVIRGRWRRRLLVRAERSVDLSAYLSAWRARVKQPPSVRVTFDVEPYSFV